MAVLARAHITSQQRWDLPQSLAYESYTAYDFRALIKALVGSNGTYVLRGFEVIGKTGLFISISIADSFVFNPLDNNGSFYLGAPDAAALQVELPPSQPFVYVEARFKNITNAAISAAYWDPLAGSGANNANGEQFTATQNSQNIIEIEISVNTVGFNPDALPITVCSTSSANVTNFEDARPDFFRLGRGGASQNPAYKFPWSTNRGEPVSTGAGVGDDVDSPFRSRDNTGILNDKGIRSFKEAFDALATRIAEISGSSLWYSSNYEQQYVSGLDLSSVFFDSIGHSLQPKRDSIYAFENYNFKNVGSQTIAWRANYADIEWQLGQSFNSSGDRGYASIGFSIPVLDGRNVFLKLERNVSKNSGNNLYWKNPVPSTSYTAFVTDYEKVVSGSAGDFSGIAVGDYIRKESQGYSQYYRVEALATASALYSDTEGIVADASVVAIKLNKDIDSQSTEPLKYFRSRYSEADLYTFANTENIPSSDYYWLGRRRGEFFYLRDYGPLYKNKFFEMLDRAWSKTKLLREYKNVFVSGGGQLTFESTPGNNSLVWSADLRLEIAGRNAVYTIPASTLTVNDGECVWVDIPELDSSTLVTPQVTAIGDVPISPEDVDHSDRIIVLYHRRNSQVFGIGDLPNLVSGETSMVGEDLPVLIRQRLGITSETEYVDYFNTYIVNANDDYATAISRLDEALELILTDTPTEEIIPVPSDTTTITASLMSWSPDVDNVDIVVYVNNIRQIQDKTGALTEDFRKTSANSIEFSYTLKAGWEVVIRDERTGGQLLGTGGEVNTASNMGTGSDGVGLFHQKVAADLQFKRIKAGTGITLTEESNDILISSLGSGGEANTASNLGSGYGVFASKVGIDLRFKSLVAGSNVTISQTATEITISATGGGGGGSSADEKVKISSSDTTTGYLENKILAGAGMTLTKGNSGANENITIATTAADTCVNRGISGADRAEVFYQKTSRNLELKRLLAGSLITLSQDTNYITIATTAADTAQNLGTGEGLFVQKSGQTLQFKSIVAGSNITLTPSGTTITISSSGGGVSDGTLKISSLDTTSGYLQSKLLAGTGISLTKGNAGANETLTVAYSATGENLTATGSVAGIFSSKDGTTGNLKFRKIKAGTDISVTENTNDITISYTGSGGGGGGSLQRYAASTTTNEEVWVLATGTGITYSRSGTIGTFVIPSGVQLISARLRLPMATIGGQLFTIVYGSGAGNGAGDNLSAADAYRPNVTVWNESTGSMVAASSTMADGFDRLKVTNLTASQINVVKLVW